MYIRCIKTAREAVQIVAPAESWDVAEEWQSWFSFFKDLRTARRERGTRCDGSGEDFQPEENDFHFCLFSICPMIEWMYSKPYS